MECGAGASGLLHILVKEGVKAKIGQVVGLIAETGEELEKLQKEAPRERLTGEPKETPPAEAGQGKPGAAGVEARRKRADSHLTGSSEDGGRAPAGYHTYQGTGPEGRIVKEDIEKAIEEQKKVAAPAEEVTPTFTRAGG